MNLPQEVLVGGVGRQLVEPIPDDDMRELAATPAPERPEDPVDVGFRVETGRHGRPHPTMAERDRQATRVAPVTRVEDGAMITTTGEASTSREVNTIYGYYRPAGCRQKAYGSAALQVAPSEAVEI